MEEYREGQEKGMSTEEREDEGRLKEEMGTGRKEGEAA